MIQRQKHVQHRSLTKIFIAQVLASETLLSVVVMKTLTEDLFTFEINPYTPIIICTVPLSYTKVEQRQSTNDVDDYVDVADV
jgi:hypothetical protein